MVFASVEQRDAAITDNKASAALMRTEFHMEHRIIRSEQKDPDRNVASDRLEKDTVVYLPLAGRQQNSRELCRVPGRVVA